jgi:RNA polymerase-binding transcription factor DksA
MATKKKAAKPAAKKPAPPKGKATKPVKSAPKKPAPAKKAVRPAPKKVVKPAAKTKPVVKAKKPVAKPVAKKAPEVKKPVKPIVKAAVKKPAPVKQPVQKPMTKKIEVKKPEAKPAPVKVAAPSAASVKPKDIKVAPPKPVVLPKINTKTSRKYQPDFTKSVLDQPKNDPGAPIVRYSDSDLTEFRELINRKLESAKKELSYLQGLITRKDEMGGDNDDARYMTMEDGSMSMEREQLSQMASRQITFIDHLEKAIMRIENKTYGVCRVTGKLIDKARLRAVPHATLSIEAKMGSVK